MTGNKSDTYGNSKLMSFGFENQGFKIQKEDQEITMNMFGVTLGSYNRLEEVYKFVFQTKNTMTAVTDNLKTQLNKDTYVQELKKAVNDAKNLS